MLSEIPCGIKKLLAIPFVSCGSLPTVTFQEMRKQIDWRKTFARRYSCPEDICPEDICPGKICTQIQYPGRLLPEDICSEDICWEKNLFRDIVSAGKCHPNKCPPDKCLPCKCHRTVFSAIRWNCSKVYESSKLDAGITVSMKKQW
jgi:hypothetical protein